MPELRELDSQEVARRLRLLGFHSYRQGKGSHELWVRDADGRANPCTSLSGQEYPPDQGVQYAATAYTELLHGMGIAISMAEVGAAWQNGFAERLMRTIKEEEVNLSEYRDYHDAYDHLGRFLDDVYLHKRIHSSLGYLTPVEFEAQWLAQHAAAQSVVT